MHIRAIFRQYVVNILESANAAGSYGWTVVSGVTKNGPKGDMPWVFVTTPAESSEPYTQGNPPGLMREVQLTISVSANGSVLVGDQPFDDYFDLQAERIEQALIDAGFNNVFPHGGYLVSTQVEFDEEQSLGAIALDYLVRMQGAELDVLNAN